MMRSESTVTWIWLGSGLAGLILLFFLFPSVHPYSGMRLTLDADGIRERSKAVLTDLKLDSVSYTILPKLRQSEGGSSAQRQGPPIASEAAAVPAAGHRWVVRIFRNEPGSVTSLRISNSEERVVDRIIKGDIQLQFDTHGKLRSLSLPVPDSVALPPLAPKAAREAVIALVEEHVPEVYRGPLGMTPAELAECGYTADDTVRWTLDDTPVRRNYSFRWSAYDPSIGDSVDVRAELAGGTVTKFSLTPRTPKVESEAGLGFISDILQVLFYAGLSILLIVTGIRRLRAYEIGFRTSFIFGGFTALLFGFWFYMQLRSEAVWEPELLFPLLLAPIMVGGAMVVIWAVGEAIGRETWREKFINVDLLTRGHFLHTRIGHALLRGIGGGLLIAGIGVAALWLLAPDGGITILHKSENAYDLFSSEFPAVFVLGDSINVSLFEFAFAVMFLLSFLRQRIRSTALLLPIAALVIVLPNPLSFGDAAMGAAVTFVPAMLIALLFLSTDVLAGLTGLTVAMIIHKGAVLLLPWNTAYQSEGFLLLGFAAFGLLFAAAALVTRDTVTDFEKIAPRFQRHISERQRLSRELEIARDVQMGFLPKHDPHFPGLDIASRCAPAMEVGGDYYDFIDLGPDKIGIAIGDVSGKGTQAAFYMTLTKGFLKALGRFSTSPSRVLVEMNRLFYENVERGNFISMIYAVFDLKTHSVTIARAGHTPVMRMDSDHHVDVIQSRGMALGFESGEKFEQTIEEVTLPIHPGDIFVLYTDGYPEAMTTKREEFGEERLAVTLQRHAGDSAAQILDGLYRETRRFAGKAEQHDDMTMVVVRVS